MIILLWVCAGLASLALMNTCINLLFWPRGLGKVTLPRISVLIPARNEASNIQAAVRSAIQSGAYEVIVYDDHSTDPTVERLIALNEPRLQIVRGEPLPSAWIGKPPACPPRAPPPGYLLHPGP